MTRGPPMKQATTGLPYSAAAFATTSAVGSGSVLV